MTKLERNYQFAISEHILDFIN